MIDLKNKQEPEKDNLIDKATSVAERIEAANKVTAELLDRQENIQARKIIGGQTSAGEEKTKKVDEFKSARDMLKGTGYGEKLFPVEGK